MVLLSYAVGVAKTFCMPGQAHWEVCLDSGRWESRQSTFLDFLMELSRFYLGGIVKSNIVVNSGACGDGGTWGDVSTWGEGSHVHCNRGATGAVGRDSMEADNPSKLVLNIEGG